MAGIVKRLHANTCKKHMHARSRSLTTYRFELLPGATSALIFSLGMCDYEAFVIKGGQRRQKKGS